MEPSFWHARWESKRIGFHNSEVHPLLQRHWERVAPSDARRVLVPLCGKSLDMHWLADRGLDVVGVELSEVAAREFFDEHGSTPKVSSLQHKSHLFRCYQSGPVSIVVGDWRHVTKELLADAGFGTFDVVYDRASLVALPVEMRETHIQQLERLCPAAPILLVTVQYEPSLRGGPPFPVFEEEVRRLFASWSCEKLDEIDSPLRDLIVQEAAYLLRS